MLSDKFFISATVEERTVELADGSKEVLFFRHLPNTDFERYAIWANSRDEDVQANAAARLLVLGLCEPDGKPAITLEQAVRIKRPVMLKMFRALLEVNEYGTTEKPGNVLPPAETSGSGTSSP
jgi:hypothetical protein